MRPLPTSEADKIPGIPLNPDPASYSAANRKTASCSLYSAYPWLLFASTAVAATFCLAYISKPYIVEGGASTAPEAEQRVVTANSTTQQPAAGNTLLPTTDSLPGEGTSPVSKTPATSGANFEETNIRVQHVLDAESPSGDISRIIVDIPVLYQSRNLRWSQQEAAEARALLARLTEHQEKTRILRDEGAQLLSAWNDLMDRSVPIAALRADSPSLPENQFDPLAPIGSKGGNNIETIKLQKGQD